MSEPGTVKLDILHADFCLEPPWSPSLRENVKAGRGAVPTASLLSPELVSRAYEGVAEGQVVGAVRGASPPGGKSSGHAL